ncbi:MAG: glycoside hydrolase family 127 protein [Deltaproteobacteria bacterium]|nr:glycoside hydrolase family 127 protein [Deltaproteobacteria bacterium]
MRAADGKQLYEYSSAFRTKPAFPAGSYDRGLSLVLAAVFLFFLIACQSAFAAMDNADAYLFPGDREPSVQTADVPALVKETADLAAAWFVNQVLDNGLFVYLYDPAAGAYPKGQSVLRQLMATRLLGIMAKNDASLLDLHKTNLSAVMNRWYREDEQGLGFMLEDYRSELGSNAMALRALVASPFFAQYSEKARKLADGICSTQKNDGSFNPYFIFPEQPFDWAYTMAFYSGEATLALVEYYEKTGEKRFLDVAVSAQDFYLSLYVPPVLPNYYPASVPWQTLALSSLYRITKNERYASAIFILNEKILEIQETRGNPGRFTNPDMERYGGTHSSSDGVYTESLAYALKLAIEKKDEVREKMFRRAITLAVQNLSSLQYKKEPLRLKSNQRSAVGAIRVRDNDGFIRIDCVQHALDAFLKIREVW